MPNHHCDLLDPKKDFEGIKILSELEGEFKLHGFKVELSRGNYHAEKIIL